MDTTLDERYIQAGDIQGLFNNYIDYVRAMVVKRVDNQDVDDVVQDIFLSALLQLDTLRRPASFKAWLRTIVNGYIGDYYRNRYKHRSHHIGWDELGTEPLVFQDHTTLELQDIIKKLPKLYKDTLTRLYIDGDTFLEAAECIGSYEMVRSRHRRAIKFIRRRRMV